MWIQGWVPVTGKNGEELQGFVPIHQFLEKCKGIYITTGSQTLKNNARAYQMKGSALYSTELVQNWVGAAPIQTVWAYSRMGLTKHIVMSQANSFGLGSRRPVVRIPAVGSHAEQLFGYGSRSSVCYQKSHQGA